jgi:hypothetical protein
MIQGLSGSSAVKKPNFKAESLTCSFEANMPMFKAIARVAVGVAPRNRPATPSSRTILQINIKTY